MGRLFGVLPPPDCSDPAKLALMMLRIGRGSCVVLFWLLAARAIAGLPSSEERRTDLVRAIEGAQGSVVNIDGEKTLGPDEQPEGPIGPDRRVNGMGTGIVIDPRGYILTNHHVVEGVKDIHVTFSDRRSFAGRVVSFDPKTDLAIVKIDAPAPLPVLAIGASDDLMIGEPVIAIGNAYGYGHTVTRGIISALDRTVQVNDTLQYENLIQTDASINPGNSGGPLLNVEGRLIGVNVAVRAGAQGIGFAIPVNKAMTIAAELLSTRRVANVWHGVTPSFEAIDGGVRVQRLDNESPAAKVGLLPGDVVTSVAGRPLSRPLDLELALLGHKADEEVEFAVRRGAERMKVSLVLAAAPDSVSPPGDSAWDVLGLRLTPIPSDQFRRLRSRYRGGLRVTAVRNDSPAARQGIRRNDVLVGMHVWETVSPEHITYILSRPELPTLDPLKFYILRGNETLYGFLPVSTTR